MYIFSKLKRSPFQGSIKKHLFKDSLLFFKKSMRSFSASAVGPLKFPYFYWSIGLPVGRPQWGTFSWWWLWLQGRITPSPGGQVALSPALQPAASPVRPSPTQASASDRCGKRPVVDQGREPTESYFKSSSRNRSGDAQTSSRSQEGKIML